MKRWNSLLGVLLLAVGAAGQGVVDTTAKSLRCARYVEEIVRGQKIYTPPVFFYDPNVVSGSNILENTDPSIGYINGLPGGKVEPVLITNIVQQPTCTYEHLPELRRDNFEEDVAEGEGEMYMETGFQTVVRWLAEKALYQQLRESDSLTTGKLIILK